MILISSLVTSLQKELGSFNSTEQHPDMYRYINSAINYIFNHRDWDWNRYVYSLTYSTAGTEQQLTVYPYKVFYAKSGDELLDIVDKETWFMLSDHTDLVCCYRDLFISDTTGSYELLYSKTAPIISATDDEIDMPDYYKDVLQIIAIHYAYKDIQNYEVASALIGQANAVLNSATDRTTNTLPRNTVRLGSAHSF